MVSREEYLLDKLKGFMQERIKSEGGLTSSFVIDIKPKIEKWSLEYDDGLSKTIRISS